MIQTRESDLPSLTVYKASAGSGKTFRLAVEYIKLLIHNPQSYRQILAVTFTNKATEEMKMRILSQLYGIWRQLDDSDDYMTVVASETGLSREHIAEKAGVALHLLLHNYSYFRVETIDSFFQSVLRNLARELDLTANLRISLNDSQVEELAVDQLIESLSATDVLLQWLMTYIMDNIGDDKSWNVIWQIKKFGKTIFRDYYKKDGKELHRMLTQKDFFENYTAMLRQMRQQARERMTTIAASFFDTLAEEGLDVTNLSYGKQGVASLFYKLQAGIFDESVVGTRVLDCQANAEKWCSKTEPHRDHIIHLAQHQLGDILNYALGERLRQWKLYKTADLTLRHLNQLRLLNSIEEKVRELNDGANRFLLSDTQQLLHELIEGSDSPFIFEKIGTQLEHIMIDEFQDTSTVQWQNFKVLLEETMSHEDSHNLIVGDVKQSIYRWRSGDWRLLANIEQEFSDRDSIHPDTLSVNRRSYANIIYFNNAFFLDAAQKENASAYGERREIEQQVPPEKDGLREGYVRAELLPAEDYRQVTLQHMTDAIQALIAQGTPPADIAILVRSNQHIPLIANHLLESLPGISVVSDEAFRLDASPAVMTIVNALRVLSQPEDDINRAYLATIYGGDSDSTLPADFGEELLQMPLYDLAERLYAMFHLDRMEGQSAYLCAFFDQLVTYVNDHTADIQAFLEEWDLTLCNTTIQSPEINGIRIISIHKSKGLEFGHVFLPFCDWRMEHNDILWCKPTEEPFDQLPLVPIDYSQRGMKGTIYEDAYEEEHQQSTIDNLNLLYVAFTRARRSLYIYGRRQSKASRSALLEQVLPDIVDQLEGARIEGVEDKDATLLFEYGQKEAAPSGEKSKDKKKSENPFLQTATPLDVQIGVYHTKVEFRQSNKSQAFAQADEDDELARQSGYIQLGNVLHEVFSTIRTTADIDGALRRLEQDGVLYDDKINRQMITNMIRKRLEDPRVADWFDPRWTLYNECTILSIDPKTGKVSDRRPDRVITDGEETIVIDFKFGKERVGYHDQVHKYMELLSQMGHRNVKGYLWFVYANKIVNVK